MPSLRLAANAKINLCLEVLRRRSDGYHDLATIFQSITLADELLVEAREAPGITLAVAEGGAPAGPGNLCWNAAEAYQRLRGWPAGVSIRLRKQIPMGGGLGGGSADAAAVLMALRELDPDPPALETLRRTTAKLGADVAFCLLGGTALGQGRGDELMQLAPSPECWACLVKPEFAVSTAEAFGMLSQEDFTPGAKAQELGARIAAEAPLAGWAPLVQNAFAGPLTRRWPVFGELKARLREVGALAAEVSGSGSVVFGLFADEQAAREAAEVMTRDGIWARPVMAAARGSGTMERNGVGL